MNIKMKAKVTDFVQYVSENLPEIKLVSENGKEVVLCTKANDSIQLTIPEGEGFLDLDNLQFTDSGKITNLPKLDEYMQIMGTFHRNLHVIQGDSERVNQAIRNQQHREEQISEWFVDVSSDMAKRCGNTSSHVQEMKIFQGKALVCINDENTLQRLTEEKFFSFLGSQKYFPLERYSQHVWIIHPQGPMVYQGGELQFDLKRGGALERQLHVMEYNNMLQQMQTVVEFVDHLPGLAVIHM